MIIENGTIQVRTATKGGGRDEYGYPIPAAESWSQEIPCQVLPAIIDNAARTTLGEPYTQASFKVLINWDDFETYTKSEQVRITALGGIVERTLQVIRCTPLQAVRQFELLV